MNTLSVILKPSSAGWLIYLTDGREVARFRGLGSHPASAALRFTAGTQHTPTVVIIRDRVSMSGG
jgi:hypothetical protein